MPVRVGVVAGRGEDWPASTLAALETVLPVAFEARRAGEWGGLDAVLATGSVEDPPPLPLYEVLEAGALARAASEPVRLSTSIHLDRPLRGASLAQDELPAATLPAGGGFEALAECSAGPLWEADATGAHHRVLPPPPDVAGSTLLEHLRPGRFLALLPLVHFLRRLAPSPWRPPPIRAAFLFDDPNLHRPRYGFVDYRALRDQAAEGGFHVSFAMVPIDAWRADREAVRLFRESPGQLSLLVHGNDHVRGELGRLDSGAAALALARRALDRVEAFERRTGLEVARVMAPPHGVYSPAALEGLDRAGFEALTASRPTPTTEPGPSPVTAGWRPLEHGRGGFPILPRIHIDAVAELAPLRAFLDQPLVIYGHHGDLAGDPERLARVAAEVDALGVAGWDRIDAITRGAVETRSDGSTLVARPLARHARVAMPPDASRLVVEPPADAAEVRTRVEGTDPWRSGATVEGPELAGRTVEISFPTPAAGPVAPAPRSTWAAARRLMTEGRDRLQPLSRRR